MFVRDGGKPGAGSPFRLLRQIMVGQHTFPFYTKEPQSPPLLHRGLQSQISCTSQCSITRHDTNCLLSSHGKLCGHNTNH